MRRVKVHLEGLPGSPYSQSRKHNAPMLDRESHDDYDIRTWREKCTVNKDGHVVIPLMGLKMAIDTTAFHLGQKVPGRRGSTYKSFFVSGFICDHDVPLANGKAFLTPKDAECFEGWMGSGGKRGEGSRVIRRFPDFHKWHAVAEFTIIDDVITQSVFEQHVKAAGMVCGIGRFRPENGGSNGRFRVTKFEWSDVAF